MENRKRKRESVGIGSKSMKDEVSDDVTDISASSIETSTYDDEKLTQETIYLTDLNKFIPDLVWKMVLDNLNHTSDIQNCSNSSPYFGLVLKSKRESKIVLPKVFDILGQRYFNQNDESYSEINTESIPWRRPLTKPDIHKMTGFWKCRLICKSWNEAIEGLHQNKNSVPFYLKDFVVEKFETHEQVQKFLLHFDSSHCNNLEKPNKNPLLGRNVRCFCISVEQRNAQVYYERLLEMVKKYGQFIWHLDFDYFNTHSTAEILAGDDDGDIMMRDIIKYYNIFRVMLLSMPNLKDIYFSYVCGARRFAAATPQQLQNLKLEISINPLPKLDQLKSVSLCQNVSSVVKEFLQQNLQIEHLVIKNIKSLFTLDSCGSLIESLTNLRDLKFTLHTLEEFELFQNVPFVFRPKEFTFDYFPQNSFIPWSSILTAIEAKLDRNICTDLSLYLPNASTDEERESVLSETLANKLNFSNIEVIKINSNAHFSFDFLLNLSSSLKLIFLATTRYYDKGFDMLVDKQKVKYLGYEDKLQHSNVWKLFPQLKMISISSHTGWFCYELNDQTVNVLRG